MHSIKHRCFIVGFILFAGMWTGCRTTSNNDAVGFYEGTLNQTEQAVAGPLMFDVWQVQYMPQATSNTSDGTRMVQTGGTGVYLKVQNMGTEPVQLARPSNDLSKPLPLPTAYLEDQSQRRYVVKSVGTSRNTSEPESSAGVASPGKSTDITVYFEDIPKDVTGLTLRWDVPASDGSAYSLSMPIPLPKTR